MPLITKYNPNIKWGKQHVEVVLMSWDYSRTFILDFGGNCRGFSLFGWPPTRFMIKFVIVKMAVWF